MYRKWMPWSVAALAIAMSTAADDTGPGAIAARGVVKAEHEVTVSAEVSAVVVEVLPREGDAIAAEALLMRLDDRAPRLDMAQQEAELKALEAGLKKMKSGTMPQEISQRQAEVEKARLEVEKRRVLYEHQKTLFEEGALSRDQFVNTETLYLTGQKDLELANLRLEIARLGNRDEDVEATEARVEKQRRLIEARTLAMEGYRIKSPLPGNGIVTRLYVSQGERAGAGQPIADLVGIDRVLVEVHLPLSDIPRVMPGLVASASVPDLYPGRAFPGEVRFVSPVVEAESATFIVRILVDNPERLLRPGMFADVVVDLAADREAPVKKPRTR